MNDLKAGFASVNVTPMTGIEIRGYFVERISEGVLDDLELRALALEAGGRRAVLMSMDVCGIHNPEADSFRAACLRLPVSAIVSKYKSWFNVMAYHLLPKSLPRFSTGTASGSSDSLELSNQI